MMDVMAAGVGGLIVLIMVVLVGVTILI